MHISYEQVTAFVALAECGSFSAAAKQLHKHRTTLGQVITNLEIEINMTLFDRSTRYPQLTEASYFMSKLTEPTSITNGMMKLSTAPYRVPADAPCKDFGNGNGMSSYATEWTMTQSLDTIRIQL
ncbi:hypothetical protein VA249_39410 [Vibrio alfacsensis]|nr:LysR family transcriptional regulator [Vibrio alfacsensis]BBM67295.1 hypothetical protein VA249_39410 [Vibrio alfacsensis]